MKRLFRFHLDKSQSPTHYNLHHFLQEACWCSSQFKWLADFSDQNLSFDLKAAQQLEFKHLLAQLVSQFCPQTIPLTYCINDANWSNVLSNIAEEHYLSNGYFLNERSNLTWILKPALLNNGQAIKIFNQLSAIESHFLSNERLGGEHVLQQYLTPHLLREFHKYSIRMFAILTNYAGAYLYPYGYFNVALQSYKANDYSDLRCHLTNEHLSDDETNVVQIPSPRFEFFSAIYPQIKLISSNVIKGLEKLYPQAFRPVKQRNMAIMGFDFMVDNHQRVWLLEANHGPCFPISDTHPLQHHLYADFWRNLIASFVVPIADNSPTQFINYQLFEQLI